MAEVLAQDAGCLEALERGLRRAEQEAWPHDAPAVRTLREAKARREELMARVRKRAEQVTPGFGPPSLEAGLRQLDAHVRELPTPMKRPEEAFSVQVARVYPWGLTSTGASYFRSLLNLLRVVSLVIVGVSAVFYLSFRALFGEDAKELLGHVEFLVWVLVSSLSGSQELPESGVWLDVAMTALVLSGVISVALWWLRKAAVWLTPERLIWLPGLGEAVTVRTNSLTEASLLREGRKGPRVVAGNRRVELPLDRPDAERLRVWLELLRHSELRARMSQVVGPVEYVVFPADLTKGMLKQEGHAVLMRGKLYFLSDEQAGLALLKAATGRTLDSRVELSWVLEILRWQLEAHLEALLEQVVKDTGGVIWSQREARVSTELSRSHKIQLLRDGESITGRLQETQSSVAAGLCSVWR